MQLCRERQVLVVGAHPFRTGRNLQAVPEAVLGEFDALDLNAKDLVRIGRHIEKLTRDLGTRLGLPVVAGSDSHQHFHLGGIWNRLAQPVATVTELKSAYAARNYISEISPAIDLRVQAGQTIKKLLRQVAELEASLAGAGGGV